MRHILFFAFVLVAVPVWASDPVEPSASTDVTDEGPADSTGEAATEAPAETEEKLPPPSVTESKSARPMHEMEGKCTSYGMDLSREFKIWEQPSLPLKAGAIADAAGPLDTARRMEVSLEREDKVRLAVRPEKETKSPSRAFAGLLRFRVPKDGVYRVAAGNRLWLEVITVRTKSRVAETSFEMQTKCPTIAKVILYNLKANENYWLQLTNSDAKKVSLLVSPAP